MATIKAFEDIISWQKARGVCRILGIMIDTGKFKRSFELIHQIEKSSGSIMDNIAEGFERGTRFEFIQFLGYAKASCGELRSQLYRAFDRNYITIEEFDDLKSRLISISGLIQNLIKYLQGSKMQGIRMKGRFKEP